MSIDKDWLGPEDQIDWDAGPAKPTPGGARKPRPGGVSIGTLLKANQIVVSKKKTYPTAWAFDGTREWAAAGFPDPPKSDPDPDPELELSGVFNMDEVETKILEHLATEFDGLKKEVATSVSTLITVASTAQTLETRLNRTSARIVVVEKRVTAQEGLVKTLERGPKPRSGGFTGFLLGCVLVLAVNILLGTTIGITIFSVWMSTYDK